MRPVAPYIIFIAAAAWLAIYPARAETASAVKAPTPAEPIVPKITAPSTASIKLPDFPPGMCPIDTSQDADRAAVPDMHLATQGEYKLLAVFAECRQLNALRAGSQKVRFLSQYGALVEQQGATVALNRQSTALVLGSAIGLTGAYASQAVQPPTAGLNAGKSSYQGILKQTADYLVVGAEQRHIVHDKPFAVASVSLITVINGRIVTANFFAPANNFSTYSSLANYVENYGKALIAKNP